MLKTMRNSFHHLKWTLFAVIIVFILGFVFFSGSDWGEDRLESGHRERRGGADHGRGVRAGIYRAPGRAIPGALPGQLHAELARALDLPRQVLDGIIERKLRLEAAKRLKLHVSDEELARAIVALRSSRRTASSSAARSTTELLRARRHSCRRPFEEELREDLLAPEVRRAREGLGRRSRSRASCASSPPERQGHDRVHPGSRQPPGKQRSQPTDADLKAYFEKNKERYRAPEQRRANYLLVDRLKVRAKISRSDAEIARRVRQRRDDVRGARAGQRLPHPRRGRSRRRAGGGREGAKAKAEIARGARQVRRGLREARHREHGRPERQGERRPAAPVRARARWSRSSSRPPSTMAPGRDPRPDQDEFGYHVIKLAAKTPARTRTLEEVRPSLCRRSRRAARRAPRPSGSRRSSPEKIKALQTTSDEELRKLQSDVVTYNTTDWFGQRRPIPGIGANPKFSDEAWPLGVGKIVDDARSRLPRGAGIRHARPRSGPPACRPSRSSAPPRAGLEGGAAGEGRAGEARAGGQGARFRGDAGARWPRYEHRGQDDDRVRARLARFPRSAPPRACRRGLQDAAGTGRTARGRAQRFVLFRVLTRTEANRDAFATQKEQLRETPPRAGGRAADPRVLQQMRAERKIEINEQLLLASCLSGSTGKRLSVSSESSQPEPYESPPMIGRLDRPPRVEGDGPGPPGRRAASAISSTFRSRPSTSCPSRRARPRSGSTRTSARTPWRSTAS